MLGKYNAQYIWRFSEHLWDAWFILFFSDGRVAVSLFTLSQLLHSFHTHQLIW
jgi:hypothetical protein